MEDDGADGAARLRQRSGRGVRPRIKICCIGSVEEAALAVRYGADAVGLVSSMPSGPGVIPEDLAREIAQVIPPAVSSFLLTSRRDAGEIIEQQRRVGAGVLQLVDALPRGAYPLMREALPHVKFVQVIHVRGEGSVDEALEVAPEVDAILLDSGDPRRAVKLLGGTGRTHDWTISREIVDRVERPVFLAGGLKPENVRAGIEGVRPFGVDVCSGVRTDGRLDERKLASFVEQVSSCG